MELRDRVTAALRAFLAARSAPMTAVADDLAPLAATLADFVLVGGKRMRPAFCYWGFRAAGGADGDTIVRAAAALELLQAGALVHDDVIDASDTRRGAPAAHRRFAALHRERGWTGDADRFGAAAAILLGDLALVWADAMLTGSGFGGDELLRAAPAWDAMRAEVMWGQYLDVVEQARGDSDLASALRVARLKTAKYTVERPLHLGALLAGAGEELIAALTGYGLPLGEAFQLRDDILGVYGDPARTGKPAGDDLREGKRTVLVAYAREAASTEQARELHRGLGDRTLDDAGIDALRTVITATGAVERVEQLIADRVAAAMRALDGAPIAADARAALTALATATTDRTG